MALFPMFVDLKDAAVLIVGSSPAARRKAELLAPYGARIRRIDSCTPEDLSPAPALVILADKGLPGNEAIARICRERSIPVNAVDDPRLCTFQFPALIRRGSLSIGISTGGASPVAAALLKDRLTQALPEDTEELLLWSAQLTARLRREIPDYARRSQVLRQCLSAAFAKGRALTEAELTGYM